MKKLPFYLLIFGILLQISGFLLAHVDYMPFVFNIVSPDYAEGLRGIRTLEGGNDLIPGMPGFQQLAEPLLSRLVDDDGNQVRGYLVRKFRRPISISQGLSPTKGVITRRPIIIDLSNGAQATSTIESLNKNLEKLKKENLMAFSIGLFALGLVLSCLSFWVYHRKSSE